MDANESVTIAAGLSERLREYARDRGVPVQEMFGTALGLGLEASASDTGRLDRRLDILERRMNSLFDLIRALGPAVVGVRALLVAWAARDAFTSSEEELMEEIEAMGRAEWDLCLGERGLGVSGAPNDAAPET